MQTLKNIVYYYLPADFHKIRVQQDASCSIYVDELRSPACVRGSRVSKGRRFKHLYRSANY